uniref:EF-hand domain-containing protein n=1 Tax=Entomoneis paludosa TaxID=265537 RepID=A0A6U3C037_9STRA|mmetsp:Transcript_33388/g.69529  ORF Transcript_33388/g.69529 Transcript_33388/m.69529 type:complete len:173 (+) Transcript_33388:110-628(+)|eukprot:CAMPEP_0172465836 /NCGR_PEP_ID=MMETSP1065-20121228/54635_1 /TAXON_ID=265537 /ORGANISM="Amphiprora paludosa, Strain CCMP125" /LENGTH=172 /DNA_ID=CAMNT_0013222481 /DNA_START=54 /DNA_END=572 /DNA_ORIENTATION=+
MKLVPIMASLPTEKDAAGKKERKELFRAFDPNGNGYLSLAEVDMALIQMGKKCPKPVIIRAYKAACQVAQEHGENLTKEGESYIEFAEFRLFLVNLKKYTLLWEIFCSLDTGHDRRIDLPEFRKGIKKLEKLGHKIEDPDAEFALIDADHGGQILFEEFGDWGLQYVYPEMS